MKRQPSAKDWLPLAKARTQRGPEPTGAAFHPEWIDFAHGIRVGNLEPHERVTQMLKFHLEQRYRTPFVIDRWGRGVYWQWICWLSKANRQAKPMSSNVNFGCAKLFISADQATRVFKSGLQVERGVAEGSGPYPGSRLQEDWDWHGLVEQCRRGSDLDRELRFLLRREEFVAQIGDWDARARLTKENFESADQLRTILSDYPKDRWAGFQLYYPMPEAELRACTGYEVIKAVCAVFDAVVPAMNACMQVKLESSQATPDFGRSTGSA